MLESYAPSLNESRTLPQKVLRVLCSSGIDCELIGMRTEPYVKDALWELGAAIPHSQVSNILNNVRWNAVKVVQEENKEGKE